MRTKTSREENMKYVLDTTIRCIKDLGIQNVKQVDVARYAGVTPRCVRQYFGNIDHLLMLAVTHFVSSRIAILRAYGEQMKESSKNGFEIIRAFLEFEAARFQDSCETSMFFREMDVYMLRQKPEIRETFQRTIHYDMNQELRVLFREIYARGIADGSIRKDCPVEHLIGALLLTIWGGMEKAASAMHVISKEQFEEALTIRIKEFEVYSDMILCYIKA